VVFVCQDQAAPTGPLVESPEVRQAKAEFMQTFKAALSGLLSELLPKPVQDTKEVREAKEEFFKIFEKALDGMVETVFLGDSQDIKDYKEKFFKTFNYAMNDLFGTVDDGIYTPEQVAARKKFQQAYKDAEAGKIEAQYLEDTPEVKKAKERFFKFFKFVLDGMLYKLAPVPGNNVIPEEIKDFYIRDEPDVVAEKLKFDKLYRDALKGDPASALAVVALEEAISNNKGDMDAAQKELDETLDAIADAVEDEYTDNESTEEDSSEEDSSEEDSSEEESSEEDSSEEGSSEDGEEDDYGSGDDADDSDDNDLYEDYEDF